VFDVYYLFTPVKTDEEKEQFKAYIESVEKKYKGDFVFGEECKELMTEVKEALQKKAKASWKTR